MLGYILRRLLATLPVMLIVAVFVFLMLRLTPAILRRSLRATTPIPSRWR